MSLDDASRIFKSALERYRLASERITQLESDIRYKKSELANQQAELGKVQDELFKMILDREGINGKDNVLLQFIPVVARYFADEIQRLIASADKR